MQLITPSQSALQMSLPPCLSTEELMDVCIVNKQHNNKMKIEMETQNKTVITVETTVNAPVEKVWEYFTKPEHIIQWNNPSDDWHTPRAENDLRVGGNFVYRMEARDGSMGFDFGGVYDAVKPKEYIEYTIGDGRKVKVTFSGKGNSTKVVESFEAEDIHSEELQRGGWQAILDNFNKHTEGNA
jgi:uncharacterized protein YndB with AHSA1/START domain